MNLHKSFHFLLQLRENNNRSWFQENKKLYVTAKKEFESFIDALIPFVKEVDPEIDVMSSKECLFRIYRDVRFSKNKLPYKTNFGAFIAKGGRKSPYAGYYIHLEPFESFIGGGIYMPESKYLRAIRTEIFEDSEKFKKIISDPDFLEYFNGIYGEKLKSAPRDFPKDFEDIELLKYKHYAVTHTVGNEFWMSDNLFERIIEIFKAQYPLNEFLNRVVERTVES